MVDEKLMRVVETKFNKLAAKIMNTLELIIVDREDRYKKLRDTILTDIQNVKRDILRELDDQGG